MSFLDAGPAQQAALDHVERFASSSSWPSGWAATQGRQLGCLAGALVLNQRGTGSGHLQQRRPWASPGWCWTVRYQELLTRLHTFIPPSP